MNTKTTNTILLLLTAGAFIAAAFLYPQLPDNIATHWNSSGNVDGYMSKFWGTFFLPLILVFLFLLYWIIPKIDPLKANIESFKKYYNGFWILIFLFMLYVYGLQIAWNLGWRFNFSIAIVPAIAALWYAIGVVIEKAKRNWFFGIRTPWTLSNDIVWDKTHKLGGKLFKFLAVISLFALFLRGDAMIFAIITPAVVVACITMVYSYLVYRKLEK